MYPEVFAPTLTPLATEIQKVVSGWIGGRGTLPPVFVPSRRVQTFKRWCQNVPGGAPTTRGFLTAYAVHESATRPPRDEEPSRNLTRSGFVLFLGGGRQEGRVAIVGGFLFAHSFVALPMIDCREEENPPET